jgi:hypothetical protein
MKKIIYVVRTNMPLLKIMGLFGRINWIVALRKEITASFVLEVWFFYYSYYILKYVVLHSAFRGESSVFTKWPVAHLK